MGSDEVEVVRAFCRFLRLKAAATPQPEGTWRSRLELDVADGVAAGESATPEAVRSMIEVGRVVDKLKQGMTAAAIATPKGPVMVSINRGAVGSRLLVSGPGVEPVEVHGIWWPDAAVVLYDALVAAGGPVQAPTVLDEHEADALAGEVVARLREGRGLGDLPECGITIEASRGGWRLTKDGEVAAVLVAADAWDRLRREIATLLRG